MALRHRDAMSPTLAAPFVPQEGDGKKPRRLMVPVWALLVAAAGGYLWASHRPQSTFDAAAPQRAAASVPASARRKFFARPAAAKFGAALVKRGWEAVNDPDKAEILWYQQKSSIDWKAVQPWQRVNHVFRETEIGHKGHLLEHLRGTPAERYLPETYTLNVAAERAAFERLVVSEGAPDSSKPPRWILKEPNVDGGKGIHVLADARAALDADKLKPEHFAKIAQRYVGNLLLFEGRKFDVRCYWVVERLKPNPRVLFHPGTLRVSLEDYNGGASGNKALHLTNAAQQKGGHSESHEAARQPMSALWAQLRNEPRAGWPADTAKHLECQMRRGVQEVFRAFVKTDVFEAKFPGQQSFVLLGADFMVDVDLEVYLSEMQSGPGLPSNTKAVRDIVEKLLPGLADIVLGLPTAPEDDLFEVLVDGEDYPTPISCT